MILHPIKYSTGGRPKNVLPLSRSLFVYVCVCVCAREVQKTLSHFKKFIEGHFFSAVSAFLFLES